MKKNVNPLPKIINLFWENKKYYFEFIQTHDKIKYITLFNENEEIGMLTFKNISENHIFLKNIKIKNNFKKKGFGTFLMKFLQINFNVINLIYLNPGLIKFYKKLDFFIDGGEDELTFDINNINNKYNEDLKKFEKSLNFNNKEFKNFLHKITYPTSSLNFN